MLLASRTEGMPACVIEAGIAGLPVAGYALSGRAGSGRVRRYGTPGAAGRSRGVDVRGRRARRGCGAPPTLGDAARARCRRCSTSGGSPRCIRRLSRRSPGPPRSRHRQIRSKGSDEASHPASDQGARPWRRRADPRVGGSTPRPGPLRVSRRLSAPVEGRAREGPGGRGCPDALPGR